MAAPKSIQAKAEALNKALARVAKLSQEIQDWVEAKTDYEEANQFFYEEHLDNPYEFDLDSALAALDDIADNQ